MITITNIWNKVIEINWTHPTDSFYYLVKQNGVRVGKTTSDKFFVHYLLDASTYTFEVFKVDGNETEISIGFATVTTTNNINYGGAEPKIIDAATVAPFYNTTNATECYINAITSANEGDIVHFKLGSGDDNWRIANTRNREFIGVIDTGLNSSTEYIQDDITILIDAGVTISCTTVQSEWNQNLAMLMRFSRAKGVRILGYGAQLYMRNPEFGVDGNQTRMSLAFYNSQQCWVEGLMIDGSGGDGIYYGDRYQGGALTPPSGASVSNYRMGVYNVDSKNNKRVALSHDSVNKVFIGHTIGQKTGAIYGTPNEFNWSYETNHAGSPLKDVQNRYCLSREASYSGVGFNLAHNRAASGPLSAGFYDFVLEDNWQKPEATTDPAYSRRRDFQSGYHPNGATFVLTAERMVLKNSPSTGIGFHAYPNKTSYDFDDLVILNPVSATTSGINEFHAFSVMRFTIGNNLDQGDFNINGLFVKQDKNQSWLSFQGSSADTYDIENAVVSNATIVTPYNGSYYNPQNKPEGNNVSLVYTQQTSVPPVTVSISSTAGAQRGCDYGNITVTRNVALNHPTPVELVFNGASERDDYDFLPPIIVIPTGQLSYTWNIKARYQVKIDSMLSVSIAPSTCYSIGISTVSVPIVDCGVIITPPVVTGSKTRAGNLLGGMLTYRSIR